MAGRMYEENGRLNWVPDPDPLEDGSHVLFMAKWRVEAQKRNPDLFKDEKISAWKRFCKWLGNLFD